LHHLTATESLLALANSSGVHHVPDEPVHPALAALSMAFGGLFGFVFGILGFMMATAFPAMLRTAIPTMNWPAFMAIWVACLAVPAYAFTRALRKGKGRDTRAFATCGIAAIVIAFAGELTGTITFFPWDKQFYIVPGPYERPSATAPPRR
jgi:membrane protein implicated in regulation of membrane protease activity